MKYLFGMIIVVTVLVLSSSHSVLGQNTYTMQNGYVEECEGILLDSEEGPEPGQYDHNEDYTFTVCVPDAREIVIAFDFFATESNYDILTIYDGPDRNSPIIATLSGIIQPPPVLVASSGCVTFHFVSDDNIVAIGWSARWMVELDEPVSPILSLDTTAVCPMSGTVFTFDRPIACENFDPSNFSLVGPANASITRVVALDCDTATGLAQRFRVEFSPPLQVPGNFRLLFNGEVQDFCGEWHDISANALFTLSNCPIEVDIVLVEDGCKGDCGTVRAEITGSSSPVYIFNWSHTSENSQEVEVCTSLDSILITLEVTDPVTGQQTASQFWYKPLELPRILNPLDGDTICAGTGDHIYQVSLPGGEFYSRIIPDGERRSGRYQFWRWTNSNGLNQDIVQYIAPNGCEVRDTFFTLPINAGSIEAACLGSSPFRVNGGTPAGGTWVGRNIDPDGTFNPIEEGTFYVRYRAPNGCERAKQINVGPAIILPDVDTICSSQRIELLSVQPFGGRWSGPGVVNGVRGTIEAWRPTPNQSYNYVYNVNGCSDTLQIFIREIDAGPNRTVCDADSLIYLNLAGNWTGPGVYVDSINAFDIRGLNTGKYTYTINRDGCSDKFELEVIIPELREKESLEYCHYDEWFALADRLELFPNYGNITGTGVRDSSGGYWFNPELAGSGRHPLFFEALGCYDTVWVEVEAPAIIPEYEFCELSSAIQLQAVPPGGTWSGPGFLDPLIGLFDPQLLGEGEYYVSYEAPSGCITEDTIEIFLFEQVQIEGISQQYCYKDTMININLSPQGGTFFINGDQQSPAFNPGQLGEGNHELFYTKGTGACVSSQRRFITVLSPISGYINASDDSICLNQSTVISIDPSGGSGIVSAEWDNGLGFGTSHIVNPSQTNWYRVRLSDGCSDPYADSVRVYVYPEFDISIRSGPDVCFEDTSWVEILTPDPNRYEVRWQTARGYIGDRYEGRPGIHSVLVTELFSGCAQEYDVVIPGEEPLRANFSLIPDADCIDIVNNEIQIIDLAIGYTDGWIDYGDGSASESLLFGSLEHEYQGIGEYVITQVVTNDLGCTDSISRKICVENVVRYFVPNIFTPNGDDQNDVLRVQVVGGTDIQWSVFDRTGGLVFEANSENDGWDGTFQGRPLNPNVFVVMLRFRDQETGSPKVQWETVTLIR